MVLLSVYGIQVYGAYMYSSICYEYRSLSCQLTAECRMPTDCRPPRLPNQLQLHAAQSAAHLQEEKSEPCGDWGREDLRGQFIYFYGTTGRTLYFSTRYKYLFTYHQVQMVLLLPVDSRYARQVLYLVRKLRSTL